ncbi:sulfatase [Bacteroidota bacterium]
MKRTNPNYWPFIDKYALLCLSAALVSTSCTTNNVKEKKPNILWIYVEDMAPFLSCYGHKINPTPNLDQLAHDGVMFTNAYMPAPVSSPCRSGIITGCMPTTLGLHNHHSSRTKESAIYLPNGYKTIPELFKDEGYFTFNNGKDDYNFMYDRKSLYDQPYSQHPLYGKKGENISLDSMINKQPFFGQIQLSGGKEIYNRRFQEMVKKPIDRSLLSLPPYYPQDSVILEEWANHYDAVKITDNRVGEILNKLKQNKLLENTIVFFFSDHGMRLTRNKQFLYDGGIHVPLIVAWYGKQSNKLKSGRLIDDLVSGLDIGTTSLGLAGINIPEYMEGIDIFSDDYIPREYVISVRDRCDFTIDRIRSVRTKKYKYIRNFMTDRPYMQLTYMDLQKEGFVLRMKELYKNGKLNSVQSRFMAEERPAEELYDLSADPYEINNLANNQEYADDLKQHSDILKNWIKKTNDQGQYPESKEGLKFMLGIWGKAAINPEYDILRQENDALEGSLIHLKNAGFKKVEDE